MSTRPDRPSPAVTVAGGVAVLLVVAFVAAVVAGSRVENRPGDRIAVARTAGPAGVTVLAGRCLDQRVTEVSVSSLSGPVWRITSEDGSIERRYVVGEEPPPLGFAERVKLTGLAPGPLLARVDFSRDGHPDGSDMLRFDATDLDASAPELGTAAPPCASDGQLGGFTRGLFVLGAGLVVAGYAVMLARRWQGRR